MDGTRPRRIIDCQGTGIARNDALLQLGKALALDRRDAGRNPAA